MALSAQASSAEMTTEEIVDRIDRIRKSPLAIALMDTANFKSSDFAVLDLLKLFKESPSRITER